MFVSDGAFTDSAVSVTLEIASNLRREAGQPLEENWVNMTENMQISTSDSGVVLEFRDMWNDLVSKQADVILMDYPFDYRRDFSTDKRRLAMDYVCLPIDRSIELMLNIVQYAVRQDPNGPAMTYALYAISANSLSESGCAFWTFLKKSFEPYIRAPWYQFSEQQLDDPTVNGGINPAFPFLTGHGGFLQIMTAGFLGIRVTDTNLVMNPSLPPQLSHFRAPIQFYNGAVITCTMNTTHTTITRLDASHHPGVAPDQYGTSPMPITIGRSVANGTTLHLSINETTAIPNRAYHHALSIPGNILQCTSATSPAPHLHGQFPAAAIDGYGGTAWQPATANETGILVVDASDVLVPQRLSHVHLDFGLRPPRRVRVAFYDEPAGEEAAFETAAAVNITAPWKGVDAPVVPYGGNVTTIALPTGAVWSGGVAKLEVEGCWVEDGAGATVAEFAVVAAAADGNGTAAAGIAGKRELWHTEL